MENFKFRIHNILIFISLIIFILITNCNQNYLTKVNKQYIECKTSFGKETVIENINSHFPKKITRINSYFLCLPPTCPPSFDCIAQYGEMSLIENKNNEKRVQELLKQKIIYHTNYNDNNNIIINFYSFKNEGFVSEKYNTWFPGKLPIPFFESYDFGLGKKFTKLKNETMEVPIYTIPEDLEIYVIDAKPGSFWKYNCNEPRPNTLKEWKHGYSKGFALSNKRKLIVYWTIIW